MNVYLLVPPPYPRTKKKPSQNDLNGILKDGKNENLDI